MARKKKENPKLQVSPASSIKDVDGEFRIKVQVITPWENEIIFRDGDFEELERFDPPPDFNGQVIQTLSFPHSLAGKEITVRVQTKNLSDKWVEETLILNMPTQFRKKFGRQQFSLARALEYLKEVLTWQKIKKIASHFFFVLIITIAISLILGAANGKASIIIGFLLAFYIARKVGWFSLPIFLGFMAWCWFNPEDLAGGIKSALWTAVIMGEFFFIIEELFHRKYEEPDGDVQLVKGFNFYPKVPIGICIFMVFYSLFGFFGEFVPEQKEAPAEEVISLSEIDFSQYEGDEIDLSQWRGEKIDLSSGGEVDSWFGQTTSWFDRIIRAIGSAIHWLLVMICLAVVGIPGDIIDWWTRRKTGGPSGQAVERGLLITELWILMQNLFGFITGRGRGKGA